MTLPVLDKTWSFNVNHTFKGTIHEQAILLKDIFLGFTAQPWTCWGSCDASTYGNGDAVDRWVDAGDITFSTGSHSWFVFNIPGLGTNTQLLIDFKFNDKLFNTSSTS